MDVVTHAASGAIAALACPHRPRTAWAVPLAALAAAAPDADVFAAQLPLDFLLLHRGITHAFAAVPLMGLLLALVLYPYWRKGTEGAWSFGKTWLFAACLVLLHIYLDCVTTYGTMVFLPFSDYRVRLNGIFIIDLFLLLPMLVAVCCAWRRPKIAAAALLWALLYPAACVGLRIYHEEGTRARLAEAGILPAQLSVLPDAFAPLFWRSIYQTYTPYTPQATSGPHSGDHPAAPTTHNATSVYAAEFVFAPAAQTVWHQGLDYRGQARTAPFALPAANPALIEALGDISEDARAFFAFTLMPVQQQRPQIYPPDAPPATEYRFFDLRFGSALPWVRKLLSMRQGEAILFQLQARRPDGPDEDWSAVRLIFQGANRIGKWQEPEPPAQPNWWQWLAGYHTFAE